MSSAHMADPTIEMWNDLERQVLEALARWRARESECEQLVDIPRDPERPPAPPVVPRLRCAD